MLDGDVDATRDATIQDHTHSHLVIFINGVKEEIPANVGVGGNGATEIMHTHNTEEMLHVEPSEAENPPTELPTLGDFFEIWRTKAGVAGNRADAVFSSTQIFGNVVDATHTLKFFVNGVENTEFQNHKLGFSEELVIRYDAVANVAPTLPNLANVTVNAGAPLIIPLDGFDADGDDLLFTVTSSNSALTTTLTNGRSLQMAVQGFGNMVFQLFEELTPRATARIIELAQSGFHDGGTFHRIINNFVIQGGDPTGTGSGGSELGDFDDDYHPDLQHTSTGLLSMAKSDDDTNDSQFFVTEVATRSLDFNHSIFGKLIEGESVRQNISNVATNPDGIVGNADDDRPVNTVRIEGMTVYVDKQNRALILKAPEGTTGGTSTVNVSVDDGRGGTIQKSFQVTIQADGTNNNPFLLPITEPIQVIGGAEKTVTLRAQDVEGNPINFSIPKQNANGAIDRTPVQGTNNLPPLQFGNPNFDVTFSPAQVNPVSQIAETTMTIRRKTGFTGNGKVTIVAHANGVDPRISGSSDLQTLDIVEPTAPTAPTGVTLVAASDTGSSNTDGITRLNNSAANTLQFQVAGVQAGAVVALFEGATQIGQATATGTTVTITTNGTATLADGARSITAKQTVSGLISANSPALSITIDSVAPVISSTAVTTANEGTAYAYDANATDANLAGLVFTLTTFPTGMTIDPASGAIGWTPNASQIGTANVTVRATDRAGNTVDQSFVITVVPANDPPTAGADTGATDEDTLLTVVAPGVLTNDDDPNDDALTVSDFDEVSTRGATVVVSSNGSFTYDPRTSAQLGTLADGATIVDTFTYTVSDGKGGQAVGTVSITVTGKADGPTPTMSIAPATVTEGNTGTAALTFTVTLSAASTNVVDVNFATSNGTAASGADYTATTGTLKFAIGETSRTITVPVLGDNIDEPNETLTLTLSNAIGATFAAPANAIATGTITDDDNPPQISIADATITEGDSGTVTAVLTISLTNPSSQNVTVAYQTANGTAASPGDFTNSNATVTFAPGETSKTISIPITVDSVSESSESFTVTLSAPTNGTLADSSATVTISDDDLPGAIQFSLAEYTVAESGGTATITVARTGGDASGITIQFATSNGTATAGSDYTAASGTLTFGAGETEKTFTIPIAVDSVMEENETVNLTLSGPTGGATLGARTTAILRITEPQETPEEILVANAYGDLLSRTPEAAGLEYYRSRLASGALGKNQMAMDMQNSLEYRTKQLNAMYQQFLGRSSDGVGLSAHLAFLASGGSWNEVRTTFLASAEYYRRAGGSDAGFLSALYRDVLGRAIDPVGQNEFGRVLKKDDRSTAVRKLLASQEARNREVTQTYDELLERTATSGEISFYSDLLLRGATEQQIHANFLSSTEYGNRNR